MADLSCCFNNIIYLWLKFAKISEKRYTPNHEKLEEYLLQYYFNKFSGGKKCGTHQNAIYVATA
jgi:hypothetical protein